jgi:hypothetical protein
MSDQQAYVQHDVQLFNCITMELDMACCEAQLLGMGLQSGNRRSSIGSASTTSTDSQMSNEEFEAFLSAALHEELVSACADAFLQNTQQ